MMYLVSSTGELILLDRFLYGLKQSPLKFQLHLAIDNPLMTSAYFIKGQRQDLATFQRIQTTYCYVAAARLLRKSSGVL